MAEITRDMKVHSSISDPCRLSPSAMENRLNEATNSMVQCSLTTSSDQPVSYNTQHHHRVPDESASSIQICNSTLGKLISILLLSLSPERIYIYTLLDAGQVSHIECKLI